MSSLFQPTRPLRGATVAALDGDNLILTISTHAPLAGRDIANRGVFPDVLISTHAPLAGRDRVFGAQSAMVYLISTHAPLAGRDASEI